MFSSSAKQLGSRGFLTAGLLVVALAAAVFIAGPESAPAQTDPGEVVNALPGILEGTAAIHEMQEQESLEAPTVTSASLPVPYDFAADFVSIDGNIDPVPGCTQARNNAIISFFDEFNDGKVNEGCTAHFRQFGEFVEADDLLRMRSEKGQFAGGFRNHAAEFSQRVRKGGGDFEFTASFRADLPSPSPDFSIYGILFIDDLEGPFIEALALQVQLDPSGQPELVAFRSAPIPPGPTIVSSVRSDFSSLDRIVLKLRYDNDQNLVFPSFSTDEGQNVVFSLDSPPLAGSSAGTSPSAQTEQRSPLRAFLANAYDALAGLMQAVWSFWR